MLEQNIIFQETHHFFFQLNWNYFLLDQLKSADKENFLKKETSEGSGIFESVGAKSIPGTIVLSFGVLF